MRLVIQRVQKAVLSVNNQVQSSIKYGLLVLVGITAEDNDEDLTYLVQKLSRLRVFADKEGKMNLSVQDLGGEIMWVSQFTLMAATAKGNRPSFIRAARPEHAIPLYDKGLRLLKEIIGREKVKTGIFGADMQIDLINDGPVTIIMDSVDREF